MSNKKRRFKNRLLARQKMRAHGKKKLKLKWTEPDRGVGWQPPPRDRL